MPQIVSNVVLLLAIAQAALGQATDSAAPPWTISTSGEAVVYVVPDQVVVSLGVENFHREMEQAKRDNASAAARLVKAVEETGVDRKDLQTSDLTLDIEYPHQTGPVGGVAGYTVKRSFVVTLKDPRRLEELTEVALRNGANRLDGIDYQTTELRRHRDDARARAVRAAREKAVAIAGELGCSVGPPRTINEGAFGFWYGGGTSRRHQYATQNAVFDGGGGGDGGEATPLGQIGVRATIAVTFDLIPPDTGGR